MGMAPAGNDSPSVPAASANQHTQPWGIAMTINWVQVSICTVILLILCLATIPLITS